MSLARFWEALGGGGDGDERAVTVWMVKISFTKKTSDFATDFFLILVVLLGGEKLYFVSGRYWSL